MSTIVIIDPPIYAGTPAFVNLSGYVFDDTPEGNPMVATIAVFDDNNSHSPLVITESSKTTGAFSATVFGKTGSTKYRVEMISPNTKNSQVFSHVS